MLEIELPLFTTLKFAPRPSLSMNHLAVQFKLPAGGAAK